MKKGTDEYLKILMYTIFGILFSMSTYLIVLNIHHYNSLSSVVVVSEIDNDYSKYKNNVNEIEEKINKIDENNEIFRGLSKIFSNMKNGGVFRLIPNTKLKYKDLYNLNDYFMEELINNGWIYNIKDNKTSMKYQSTIDMLSNNSKYLNSVFINNSLILYDDKLDNKINDSYHLILSNYLMYSDVLLNICNELGGGNE